MSLVIASVYNNISKYLYTFATTLSTVTTNVSTIHIFHIHQTHLQSNGRGGASDNWVVDTHTHDAVSAWSIILPIRTWTSKLEVKLSLAIAIK
jgi:hypothetical protein